jgi:integrase/recombinase XerD
VSVMSILSRRFGFDFTAKGDKWRKCPLWPETVELLKQPETVRSADKTLPRLASRQQRLLTRFGIYKIVERHTVGLRPPTSQPKSRSVSPHVFRHSITAGYWKKA